MIVTKIGQSGQIVIPKDVCEALGAEVGDFIEFVPGENGFAIKLKKPTAGERKIGFALPPAPSREERNRMLYAFEETAREPDAEDFFQDSEELINVLKKARTSKADLRVSLE